MLQGAGEWTATQTSSVQHLRRKRNKGQTEDVSLLKLTPKYFCFCGSSLKKKKKKLSNLLCYKSLLADCCVMSKTVMERVIILCDDIQLQLSHLCRTQIRQIKKKMGLACRWLNNRIYKVDWANWLCSEVSLLNLVTAHWWGFANTVAVKLSDQW